MALCAIFISSSSLSDYLKSYPITFDSSVCSSSSHLHLETLHASLHCGGAGAKSFPCHTTTPPPQIKPQKPLCYVFFFHLIFPDTLFLELLPPFSSQNIIFSSPLFPPPDANLSSTEPVFSLFTFITDVLACGLDLHHHFVLRTFLLVMSPCPLSSHHTQSHSHCV